MLDEFREPAKIFVPTARALVTEQAADRLYDVQFVNEVARALTILAAGMEAEAGRYVDPTALKLAEEAQWRRAQDAS
jgi:hypothetical protein